MASPCLRLDEGIPAETASHLYPDLEYVLKHVTTEHPECRDARSLLAQIRLLNWYDRRQWSEYVTAFRPEIRPVECTPEVGARPSGPLAERILGAPLATNRSGRHMPSRDPGMLDGARKHRTVGMVSGCFDILHLGHIELFRRAQQHLCRYPDAVLCAFVLSDEQCTRKKGPTRPIMNECDRLTLLGAVSLIDYVGIVVEPDCRSLIRHLKPQWIFKSADAFEQHSVRQEREDAEAMGGQMLLYSDLRASDVSTTRIIKETRSAMLNPEAVK